MKRKRRIFCPFFCQLILYNHKKNACIYLIRKINQRFEWEGEAENCDDEEGDEETNENTTYTYACDKFKEINESKKIETNKSIFELNEFNEKEVFEKKNNNSELREDSEKKGNDGGVRETNDRKKK